MSQIEDTSRTTQAELRARKENYLQWRQRLAEQQQDIRNLGEGDPEPSVNPEWSPDALFRTDDPSTPATDVARADLAPADVAPAVIDPPTPDPGWDRAEVDALLRQFRATGGSPRTTPRDMGSPESVGEQLRELNRLRVEGELDEDEFNRRKQALFAQGPTRRRPSP